MRRPIKTLGMEPLQKILLDECRRAGSERNLAKELGCSQSHLSQIIAGRRPVPDRIASMYGYMQLVRHPEGVTTMVYRKKEE